MACGAEGLLRLAGRGFGQGGELFFQLGEVASKEKLFKFLDALTGRIRQSPRLKDEEHTRSLLINVSNIFTRANITEQELNSLYGIVNILSDGKKDGK